jgi:hypothetical protein
MLEVQCGQCRMADFNADTMAPSVKLGAYFQAFLSSRVAILTMTSVRGSALAMDGPKKAGTQNAKNRTIGIVTSYVDRLLCAACNERSSQ